MTVRDLADLPLIFVIDLLLFAAILVWIVRAANRRNLNAFRWASRAIVPWAAVAFLNYNGAFDRLPSSGRTILILAGIWPLSVAIQLYRWKPHIPMSDEKVRPFITIAWLVYAAVLVAAIAGVAIATR
jgi:hypothetical protein